MNAGQSVIAITGAGGGLGAAMARRFAAQGARLALIDLRSGMLDEVVSSLDADAQNLLVLPCDVSKEPEKSMQPLHGLPNTSAGWTCSSAMPASPAMH